MKCHISHHRRLNLFHIVHRLDTKVESFDRKNPPLFPTKAKFGIIFLKNNFLLH